MIRFFVYCLFSILLLSTGCIGANGADNKNTNPKSSKFGTYSNLEITLPEPKEFWGSSCATLVDDRSICWGRYFGDSIKRKPRCSIQDSSVFCESSAQSPKLFFKPIGIKNQLRVVCAYGDGKGEILCWDRSSGKAMDPKTYLVANARIIDISIYKTYSSGGGNLSMNGCAAYDFSDHSEMRCWRADSVKVFDSTKLGEPKIDSIGLLDIDVPCAKIGMNFKCTILKGESTFEVHSYYSDIKQIFTDRPESVIENGEFSKICVLRADNSIYCAYWYGGQEIVWSRTPSPWDFQGFKGFSVAGSAVVLAKAAFVLPSVYGGAWTTYPNLDSIFFEKLNSVYASYLLTCLGTDTNKNCWFDSMSGEAKQFTIPSDAKIVGSQIAYCWLKQNQVYCGENKKSDVAIDFQDGPISDVVMSTGLLCAKGQSRWSCRRVDRVDSMANNPKIWNPPSEAFNVTQAGVSESSFCGLLNGAPTCWSQDQEPLTPALSRVEKFSVGDYTACALSGGDAMCWWLQNGAQIQFPDYWKGRILDVSPSTVVHSPPYSFRHPQICALTTDGFGCIEPKDRVWYPFK